ncbi:MBL fold metallo-hydrolase [Thermosyntropha sp.]|uniref:MBL fold metallo-hydrolase n=1 Tax=Thermosyntropha sp. TaxID=2740820 RepID=UPI0025D35B99|nr:MBL fold metallo-hydrolase [Thermosyntropha sp.]MBO8159882.1 MBL fold metallo-hydrolase [Thermosyntropha sp.]
MENCRFTFADFTLHVIKGYICNIFLLEYPHGLLLLDSGSINDVKRIEKYCLKYLGCSPSKIKLTIVSHMHPDHSGGANTLREKYHIPITAYHTIDNWYSGIGGRLQHKLDCLMAQSVAHKQHRRLEKTLFNPLINPDYPLYDGDFLPFFPDWQVLHVPGHTLHDIALFNKKENIMYIADIIVNLKKDKFVLPLPVLFRDKMSASLKRLENIGASLLLPAHGSFIKTDEYPNLYSDMQKLLSKPPSNFERRIYLLSIYSPEIWKEKKQPHNFK